MVLKLYINRESLVKFLQGENAVMTKTTADANYDTEILISTNEYDVSSTIGLESTGCLTIQRKRRVI
jgi:hypothetical protein